MSQKEKDIMPEGYYKVYIDKVSEIAKQNNIPLLVDAAQSIAHHTIDTKKINCDFLVFSGHKIMGPTGVGILYIKEKYLNMLNPFLRGGQMIKEVSKYKATWNDPPWKFEAGTPNIAQVIGLSKSIVYIKKLYVFQL